MKENFFDKNGERKFQSSSQQETQQIASDLVQNLDGQNIVLFYGDLGAGKTTFCQGILEFLDAEKPYTSPTFVVMKEYLLSKERCVFNRVYHFDCYRINELDLDDLSWQEIVQNKENLVLVEWPEKIRKALPKKNISVEMKSAGESLRDIFLRKN